MAGLGVDCVADWAASICRAVDPAFIVTLSVEDRVRRTVILCAHCLRNIAFYRAGWNHKEFRVKREFWIDANGSFVDIAVLEWCKLFADRRGKHHWSKTVENPESFLAGLYARLGITHAEFLDYVQTVKHPRDKFIAHLDDERVMYVPFMRPARASAAYLHDHLLTDAGSRKWFRDEERTPALERYKLWYQHAYREYRLGKGFKTTPSP